MKQLTVNIEGMALRWALAVALGRNPKYKYGQVWVSAVASLPDSGVSAFDHSNPALWASLVEKNRLRLTPSRMSTNEWYCDRLKDQANIFAVGTTPAEAVARCIVMMNIGSEVEIPDELVSQPERSRPSSADYSVVHHHD